MVAYQLFFFFQITFKLVQAPPRLGEQDCSVWHCWGLPTPFSCCKQNLGYTLQEWVTTTVIQARLEHLLWPHVVTVGGCNPGATDMSHPSPALHGWLGMAPCSLCQAGPGVLPLTPGCKRVGLPRSGVHAL